MVINSFRKNHWSDLTISHTLLRCRFASLSEKAVTSHLLSFHCGKSSLVCLEQPGFRGEYLEGLGDWAFEGWRWWFCWGSAGSALLWEPWFWTSTTSRALPTCKGFGR